MEGNQSTNSDDTNQSARAYFDYLFPYSIVYGLPYEEYWFNSDYMLLWGYVDAYKIKRKLDRDYDNHLSWLSGYYVREAVASVLGNKEYAEPIDYKEMDRWNSLTKEEQEQELLQQAVVNSRTQMERAMHELKKNKKKEGE